MIQLDASSVLLQWATGGLFFLWVTGRHRLVGPGYGWLLRSSFGVLALLSALIGFRFDPEPVRDLAAVAVTVATAVVLAISVARRRADAPDADAGEPAASADEAGEAATPAESGAAVATGFDPRLDLIAPALGLIGLVGAGLTAGDPAWLAVARMVVGAAFLGAVSDAMLLGHWYLVQPGLTRAPLIEMVRWTGALWLPEVALLLVPIGMVSVWTGAIDDGFAGLLGWFWAACVITTIGLVAITLAALRERQYSAVMAATGLLYLAILTGFGIDLVARATLS